MSTRSTSGRRVVHSRQSGGCSRPPPPDRGERPGRPPRCFPRDWRSSSARSLDEGVMSADLVTLAIDGKEITVPKGTLIIRAAEELGIEIPRFCDHPLLDPVAACRQCYVKVEGQRKLMTSCSTPVAAGMKVLTQYTDDEVHHAQVSEI